MKEMRASLRAPIGVVRDRNFHATWSRLGRRLAASAFLAGTALALVSAPAQAAAAPVQASCHFQSAGNQINRVVFLQFDNVHLRRDNPNVPSDLEQMPHLLNFLQDNGTVSGNHFTPLISHTAQDIVTSLTGLYGDRFGWAVANSFGFFRPDGSVGFASSFLYWNATSVDGNLQMVNEQNKMAPAPWVPLTRAGRDVGGFSTANIEFERLPADVITVYGANSAEAAEANANFNQAVADFEGIALHCAQNSPLCAAAGTHAKPDLLPDEPNGYTGFNGIFGNLYLQPVINPSGPVKDLDGNVIANVVTDNNGNVTGTFPGFPGFDPSASQSLGYVATLLEAAFRSSISTLQTPTTTTPLAPKAPSVPARRDTSPSLPPMTRHSTSSSRDLPRMGSPRTTRSSSSPPTRTIISSAVRRVPRTATASTCRAPTPRSARSIL
jgi:hypothetical protein